MDAQIPLLSKIAQLTTSLGIYQHGKLDLPNPNLGYALEDQARALIVAQEFNHQPLKEIYLRYILKSKRKDGLLFQYAFDDQGFLDNEDQAETRKAQEAYGITVWGLIKSGAYLENKEAESILSNLKNNAENWSSPRAMATALIGLSSLKKEENLEKEITRSLLEFFQKVATPRWSWFENTLTYANAILPWALWEEALLRNNPQAAEIAKKSTLFLLKNYQTRGVPSPVGNNGWFPKDGVRTVYDQQTIESGYLVCCLEKAYLVTKEEIFFDWAKKWWGWFFGNNLQKVSLVKNDWSCYDGLAPWGPNLNQGAESNLCFLLALQAAKRMKILQPEIAKLFLENEVTKNRNQ